MKEFLKRAVILTAFTLLLGTTVAFADSEPLKTVFTAKTLGDTDKDNIAYLQEDVYGISYASLYFPSSDIMKMNHTSGSALVVYQTEKRYKISYIEIEINYPSTVLLDLYLDSENLPLPQNGIPYYQHTPDLKYQTFSFDKNNSDNVIEVNDYAFALVPNTYNTNNKTIELKSITVYYESVPKVNWGHRVDGENMDISEDSHMGTHKIDNTYVLTSTHPDIPNSDLNIGVTRISRSSAVEVHAETIENEDYTITRDENGVTVTLLRPGTYNLEPQAKVGDAYEAIGDPLAVTISPLKIYLTGDDSTAAWSNHGNELYFLLNNAQDGKQLDYEEIQDEIAFSFTPYFNGKTADATPSPAGMPDGRPSNFGLGFWEEMKMLMASGQNVDGYYRNIGTEDYSYDGTEDKMSIQFPCSGVYKLTVVTTSDGIEVDGDRNSMFATVYPTSTNYFEVTTDGKTWKNTFNVNGILAVDEEDSVRTIYYPYEDFDSENPSTNKLFDSEQLQYALLYIPGVYLADFYWYSSDLVPYGSVKTGETSPVSSSSVLYRYDDNTTHPDMSDLINAANGYTFSVVLKKNGAETPEAGDAEVYKIIKSDSTTSIPVGIGSIRVDNMSTPSFYTLQGMKVDNPGRGLFIKIEGGKASKVFLK